MEKNEMKMMTDRPGPSILAIVGLILLVGAAVVVPPNLFETTASAGK